ncbi:hypothetical protein LP416_11100 [Polaromonas sp. P2-4]|nr:hypothetical protein LP416_11100 [Polaromonas sp. P2-4]
MTTAQPMLQTTQDAYTVLFVDDEPQTCKWFTRLFSNEFSIITACSVDEALQALLSAARRLPCW